MIELQGVTYVRLGTRDIEGATRFATDVLGLEIAEVGKGAVYFKSDQREHTLCYVEGDSHDQAVAFEVGSHAELSAAASELERLGHSVHAGTPSEAEARKVREFIAFNDPTGNRIEFVWRPAHSGARYHGKRDAGITGFSHVGLCTTDAVRDEAFWTRVCNARVSDRVGDAPLLRINEVLLHCSRPTTPVSSTSTTRSRAVTTSCVPSGSSRNGRSESSLGLDGTPLRQPNSSILRVPTAWSSNIRPA